MSELTLVKRLLSSRSAYTSGICTTSKKRKWEPIVDRTIAHTFASIRYGLSLEEIEENILRQFPKLMKEVYIEAGEDNEFKVVVMPIWVED